MPGSRAWAVLLALVLVGGCRKPAISPNTSSKADAFGANVTASRITDADHEPGNWFTHGRTYSEQRFSPMALEFASN